MKKYHQSNLIKNIKFISLLCFLFLGLVGCKGNNTSIQIPSNGSDSGQSGTTPSNGSDSGQSGTTMTTTTTQSYNEQSNIVDRLMAPTINEHTIALFSINNDVQIEGYQILYQVIIASDEQFTNTIYDEHISIKEIIIEDGTSYFIPDFENVTWPTLTTGQTYYVKVRRVARKEGENDIHGAYSNVADFIAPDLICFTPVPQTTTLDSNQQSHVLNFLVHAENANCSNASTIIIHSYEIQIASDEQFNNIEYTGTMNNQINLSNLTDLSKDFTLTSTLNSGTYYWKVRNRISVDTDNIVVGPYSDATQLSVEDATQ